MYIGTQYYVTIFFYFNIIISHKYYVIVNRNQVKSIRLSVERHMYT